MSERATRRDFVKTGAAAAVGAVTAASSKRAVGANDRIRLGFIGVANRGGQLIEATLPCADAEIVALCDVDEDPLGKRKAELGTQVSTHKDFREILDRKDIDAVVIATPDHWHAIQTIDACEAGKDVYVEKPLSITVVEGRRMVEAARRNDRVVQVGTHRRSCRMFGELAERVQAGEIGKVTVARCYRLSNMWPDGIGKAEDSAPPPNLDWDMWLGPRPLRPYNETVAPYKFRWWKSYSSQIGNWGVHYIDLIRWLLGETAPASISSHGGRFAVDDNRTIPDTMETVFEFASGRLLIFGQYEASGNSAMRSGEAELRGTKGTLYVSAKGYEIVPERGGQFQDREPRMAGETVQNDEGDLTAAHIRNFLDCIESRSRPNADVEEGHRSTAFAHLGNISLAARARIEWDAEAERIASPAEANELLHYEYRKPWTLG